MNQDNASLRQLLQTLEEILARKPEPVRLNAGDCIIPDTSITVIHGSCQSWTH